MVHCQQRRSPLAALALCRQRHSPLPALALCRQRSSPLTTLALRASLLVVRFLDSAKYLLLTCRGCCGETRIFTSFYRTFLRRLYLPCRVGSALFSFLAVVVAGGGVATATAAAAAAAAADLLVLLLLEKSHQVAMVVVVCLVR